MMPQASVLLAFLAATLALNFTPGADMAYVQAQSEFSEKTPVK
jgi:threonine/homoserine/homoserine lactone efflux protein